MPDLMQTIGEVLTNDLFRKAFWAVVIAAATLAVTKVATRGVAHILNRDGNPLPTSSILVNIVRGAILVVGASIILDSCFGVNTSSLVTALGVGGIAVSLGFQDTLANLIGGLQVTFMGIIKPGDNIEVGSETGVVQDVSWRHTTIRDALGQTIIVPNSVISTTSLVHLLPATRVAVPFAISRRNSSEGADAGQRPIDALTDQLIEQARTAAQEVSPVTDGPRVFLSEITEFGVKGKVILQIEDASKTSLAADAIVRAISRELV